MMPDSISVAELEYEVVDFFPTFDPLDDLGFHEYRFDAEATIAYAVMGEHLVLRDIYLHLHSKTILNTFSDAIRKASLVRLARNSYYNSKYQNINLRLPFTGTAVVTRDYDALTAHFKTSLDLIFENGRLVDTRDAAYPALTCVEGRTVMAGQILTGIASEYREDRVVVDVGREFEVPMRELRKPIALGCVLQIVAQSFDPQSSTFLASLLEEGVEWH